jgi:hypothetical protein
MPYYDHRDLVTDDDAYYTKEELKELLSIEPERATYAEYSEMLKAWLLFDNYTGKLYIQPTKQLEWVEFSLVLKEEGEYE